MHGKYIQVSWTLWVLGMEHAQCLCTLICIFENYLLCYSFAKRVQCFNHSNDLTKLSINSIPQSSFLHPGISSASDSPRWIWDLPPRGNYLGRWCSNPHFGVMISRVFGIIIHPSGSDISWQTFFSFEPQDKTLIFALYWLSKRDPNNVFYISLIYLS